jgi:hypothetical protein
VIRLRIVEWTEHVSHLGDRRGACRVFWGKPEGNISLGKPRVRWEDNMKMGLQEMGLGTWTGFIWLRIRTVGGLL